MWKRARAATDAQVTGSVFYGKDSLPHFLSNLSVLVCLLPLTPETEFIIDTKLLALLPRGATVINAARGKHVVEADLLAALDSGATSAICLQTLYSNSLPLYLPL